MTTQILMPDLSPFNPSGQRVAAGRLMLSRIQELIHKRKSFAIETTLSGRTLDKIVLQAKKSGYKTTLHYLFLNNVQMNIRRIKGRVRQGGHDIPNMDVRRRYYRSLDNLFNMAIFIFDDVCIYSNDEELPFLVAEKQNNGSFFVFDKSKWNTLIKVAGRQ